MTGSFRNILWFPALAALMLFSPPLCSQVQPEVPHLVPPRVHQKFLIENPDVKARWRAVDGLFIAQYVNPVNNIGHIVVYDTAGNVLRREKEMEAHDYPAVINDYFEKHHPNEGYVIWSSTDTGGNVHFYTQHREKTIRFDRSGKPLNDLRYGTRPADTLYRLRHR